LEFGIEGRIAWLADLYTDVVILQLWFCNNFPGFPFFISVFEENPEQIPQTNSQAVIECL